MAEGARAAQGGVTFATKMRERFTLLHAVRWSRSKAP
jgi:hypothetical protein